MQAQGSATVNIVVVANNQATLDSAVAVVKKGAAENKTNSETQVNVVSHLVGQSSSELKSEGKSQLVILAAETQEDFEKVKAEHEAHKKSAGNAKVAVVAKSDEDAKKWGSEVGAASSFTLDASSEVLANLATAARSALNLKAGVSANVGAGLGL